MLEVILALFSNRESDIKHFSVVWDGEVFTVVLDEARVFSGASVGMYRL